MDAATLSRDPFMPRPPKGRGPALALALLAHVLLIAALAFGVHWHTFEPNTVAAELWSAVPQAAAPRAVEPPPAPTPTPPEVRKPEPVVKQAEPVAPPKPPPPALPDPQIAIEQAKREAAQRALAEQEQQKLKREKAEQDKAARAKAALEKQRAQEELARQQAQAEKVKAEQEKALAAKRAADAAAAARAAYLKRMLGQAGATGGPTDTGSAARASGPSASYAGRIMARIKPNIVFSDTVDGNPLATVEVTLAPDGTIIARRLVKSSGVKSWDDAVLRAIDRTEILPRDIDGRVPPPFQIDFRLHD
ncbi:MAG: cell envelope integrity protein TolA [Burkholderiales bacterium]|nr:cell envelope integrity protein TolA [Burkholderiales bacterium]